MSIFSQIKAARVKKTKFDLTHERKFSLSMGMLTPIMCKEVLPGDVFNVNSEFMMRLAPMLAPVMHRVDVYTHFFFVPNRLVWDEWKDFITGGKDGNANPVFPHISVDPDPNTGFPHMLTSGSLADYLECPVGDLANGTGTPVSQIYNAGDKLNALPFRGYQLIYNEYYRDQNLQNEIDFSIGSGEVPRNEVESIMFLQNRAWKKDYFTSALPFPQKGADVELPIGGEADVVLRPDGSETDYPELIKGLGQNMLPGGLRNVEATNQGTSNNSPILVDQTHSYIDPKGSLKADLSTATSTTINELRRAFSLQSWFEKNARGGSRYIEQMLSHFGVRSSDARLQRPEFLGGGKSPIVISEVLQTSSTDSVSPQANMSGHGISVGNTHRFKRFFEEHGYVFGIMSVLPKATYQQGLPRHFTKFDKFDYAWPSFAHLGEQEVYTTELYKNANVPNDRVFGYQSRYSEYKYFPDTVHGDMRNSLNYWHMGRIFDNEPRLNSSFIRAVPTQRIFAVTDPTVHKLYVQLINKCYCLRPLPRFGTPRTI